MGAAATKTCLPLSPAATMLTADDKKLILQIWEKVLGHQEDFGAEALERCGPGLGTPQARGASGWEPHGGSGVGGPAGGHQH